MYFRGSKDDEKIDVSSLINIFFPSQATSRCFEGNYGNPWIALSEESFLKSSALNVNENQVFPAIGILYNIKTE